MPDVVCMDLQDAQDLIQEQGVFYSKSSDATGQGRRQIRDSNWVVVSQTPAAGEAIGEGDAELAVVKDGEPSICNPQAEDVAAPPPTTLPPAPAPTTTERTTTTTTSTTTTLPPPPPPPPTTAEIQPFFPQQDCDPNYSGCVPIASDVDCAGGSGNGPAYVSGPVEVIGVDIYKLDHDKDGYGCE